MGAGVRPEPKNDPADLWDAMVKRGVAPDEATRLVAARFGAPPKAAGASREWDAPEAPKPGLVESLDRVASQGLSFGFADELTAAAKAPFSDRSYRQILEDEQASDQAARDRLPWWAEIGTEGLAGVVSGSAAMKALAATPRGAALVANMARAGQGSKTARAAKVLGVGAASGAAAGAGTAAEGERVAGAVRGAGFGAGTTGVLGAVGKAAHAVTKPFHPIARQGTIKGRAVQLLGGETVEDAAKADVLKQLDRGGVTLDVLGERARNALPDEMLLDPSIGGDAMLARASGAAAVPSTGATQMTTALKDRRGRLPKAVVERARDVTGRGRENQVRAAQRIRGEQLANAKPLYDKAFTGAVVDDPDVLALFQDATFQDAYEIAARRARRRGIDVPESLVTTEDMGGETVRSLQPIPLQVFQFMKESLDDAIETGGKSKRTVGRGEAYELRQMLTEVMGKIDEQFPDYKAARAQFATDAERREAQAAGRKFLTTPRDEFTVLASEMGNEARQELGGGMLAALEDEVSGRGGVPLRLDNTLTRDKLRDGFGDEAGRRLGDDLKRFRELSQNTERVIGNSATAQRLLQAQDAIGGEATEAMLGTMTGNPMSALAGTGLRAQLKQRLQGLTSAQVDALGPYLTRMGPDQLLGLVDDLRAYEMQRGVKLTPAQVGRHAAARIVAGNMANRGN